MSLGALGLGLSTVVLAEKAVEPLEHRAPAHTALTRDLDNQEPKQLEALPRLIVNL